MNTERAYTSGHELIGWQLGGDVRQDANNGGYWYNPKSGVFHSGKETRLEASARDFCGIIRRVLRK